MRRIPAILTTVGTQLWYAFFAPAFFMFLCSVYQPFGMRQLLDHGRNEFFVNIVLMTCILMGVLAVTRFTFYFINRKNRMNWWGWASWVLLELTACTYMLALFVNLRIPESGQYFVVVAVCLQYTFLILSYPYFSITVCSILASITQIQTPSQKRDSFSVIHFTDMRKQVKLSVVKDSVLYIAAEENYIRITYRDGNALKNYTIRASMSSIAHIAEKYGLFRCHRSYYVNPSHIKAVRMEKSDQITAEMDMEGLSIPVSRMKFKDLTQLL